MNTHTNSDLICYVLGELPIETVQTIEAQAKADRILAAKIEMMRDSIEADEDCPADAKAEIPEPTKARVRWWIAKPSLRKAVIAASILVVACGMTWAGYKLLSPRVLLQDNFNADWFDSRIWKTGRRGVREMNGGMRLMNRGSLVTKKEFAEPLAVSFRWKWIDHAEDPLYADELVVALRTTGEHKKEHSYEILDGVLVRFNTWEGSAAIFKGVSATPLASVPRGSLPLSADEWRDIRITDDGETVSVYLTGKGIDPKYGKTPLMQARCPDYRPGGHIGVYNRELLADAVHESWLDDFLICALK